MNQKAGFTFSWLCFPFYEWDNWKWSREYDDQMFAVGPMRFKYRWLTIDRSIPRRR